MVMKNQVCLDKDPSRRGIVLRSCQDTESVLNDSSCPGEHVVEDVLFPCQHRWP